MPKKKTAAKKTAKKSINKLHSLKSPSNNFKISLGIIALLFLGAILVFRPESQPATTARPEVGTISSKFNFENAKIMLNEQELSFVNGTHMSSDKMHAAHWSNQELSPSQKHGAAIMIDSPEGSGTFYYVVGATMIEKGHTFSAPLLLGDRVMIRSVVVEDGNDQDNGTITVTYLDRKENEPMTSIPTIETVKKFLFEDNGNLIEIPN